MLVYDFDIVGGPFDGAPALAWRDDGKHPPPDVILVGVCGRGRDCGTSKCKRAVAHISYWLPEEKSRPADAHAYRKQQEFLRRTPDDELHGAAVYVVGGLLDPRNFGARARVPEASAAGPAVPAGSIELAPGRHDRGWPR